MTPEGPVLCSFCWIKFSGPMFVICNFWEKNLGNLISIFKRRKEKRDKFLNWSYDMSQVLIKIFWSIFLWSLKICTRDHLYSFDSLACLQKMQMRGWERMEMDLTTLLKTRRSARPIQYQASNLMVNLGIWNQFKRGMPTWKVKFYEFAYQVISSIR